MTTRFRFRTGDAAEDSVAPVRVDREARVIYGVQVLKIGEAKGHNMLVDAVMLQQTVDGINATGDQGLKSRWTHPGLCADGMGKMLGRLRNARIDGDAVYADLHLAAFASASPDGDLATYAMDIAEQDPSACGMSIAFTGSSVWKLEDGTEVDTWERPKNATTDLPFARISNLSAADLVDEPAATSGMFAAAFGRTSNTDAAHLFEQLDQLRERFDLGLGDLQAFLDRYAAARDLTATPKDPAMSLAATVAIALAASFPEHIDFLNERIAAGDDEATLRTALGVKRTEALTAKVADLQAQLAAKDEAHGKALAEKDQALATLQAKYDALSALGGGAPKDPGSSGGPGHDKDTIQVKWDAMSATERSGFFNDINVFREADRMRAVDHAKS